MKCGGISVKCGGLDDETLAELEVGVRGLYMEDEKANCPECTAEKKEHYCSTHKKPDSEYYFNKLTETPKFVWIILSLVVFSILCAPFIAIMLNGLAQVLVEQDLKALAAYGDSFGGLNALFSGLAFAGLIWTILLQRKELSLQRLELSETRKELKKSAAAQEEASKHQEKLALLQAYSTSVSVLLEKEKSTREERHRIRDLITRTTNHTVNHQAHPNTLEPDIPEIERKIDASEEIAELDNLQEDNLRLQQAYMDKITKITTNIDKS